MSLGLVIPKQSEDLSDMLLSAYGVVERIIPSGSAIDQSPYVQSDLLAGWLVNRVVTIGQPTATVHTLIETDAFADFDRTLHRARSLQPNWDGLESTPPNDTAIENCQRVLETAARLELVPARLFVASESIFVHFTRGVRYADIECDNDGLIIIVLSDRTAEPMAWASSGVDLADDFSRIRAFLI
jgi:hypothetical protein